MIHAVSLQMINTEHVLISKVLLPGLPRKLLVFARRNCIGFAEFMVFFEDVLFSKLDWEQVKIAARYRFATQQPVWGEMDFIVEPDQQYAVLSDYKAELLLQLKEISGLHVKAVLIGRD